ncbi:DUF29 domain-containing protein [Candidatus Methylobacter oryzae]|uniref:DUF29 domain-containing protein n=1 Tax=Candidatus Methylobacter oryzae TaxID=2497749 RepID=A0ABY3CCK2_9GAMM|nr:DUF29 domain-containing protein [Candidatus Methylobacter oryzae]TRW98989.1 DUF29 domain-containing protein [Candidatus Methylobacter oryzae]
MISYDKDFYGWTQEQAALLRAGRLNDLDIENLIEEVETMGRSEKRALESRLSVLLLHMLKWHYQPSRRGNSWRYTIIEQRLKFQKVLSQNPGLKPEINAIVADAYEYAALKATHETGLRPDIFPQHCPWNLEQISDSEYFPD